MNLGAFSVVAGEVEPLIVGRFDGGDTKLYLECYGSKSPTIVVHSSFNGYGSQRHWDDVIKVISQENRICLYDRAHMGKSDKLTKANNVNDASRRLHILLRSAGVRPPFIMAGHSYGAYSVKAYNHLYSEDVVGILLIDPSQYGWWTDKINKWQPEIETYEGNWEVERLEDLSYFQNPKKNIAFYDLKVNEEIVKRASDFGDKPYVLLWAKEGIWDPNTSDFIDDLPAVWQRSKDSYLAAIEKMHTHSSNTKIVFSKTSEHDIHYYEPETVIQQLRYLLNQVAQSSVIEK
jgi:pimeloyl-ACP methyl ester carboxylesterase